MDGPFIWIPHVFDFCSSHDCKLLGFERSYILEHLCHGELKLSSLDTKHFEYIPLLVHHVEFCELTMFSLFFLGNSIHISFSHKLM